MADMVAPGVERARQTDAVRLEGESALPGGAFSSAGFAAQPSPESGVMRPAAGLTGTELPRPERTSGSGDCESAGSVGSSPTGAIQHWLRRSSAGPEGRSDPMPAATSEPATRRPDPVLRRSVGAEPGVIRRFFAVVDKPEPGKTYGQVGGVPYEWRPEERDKDLWEESPIKTGWWMRRLYQRAKSVEPGNGDGKGVGKGLDEEADKAADKGADKASGRQAAHVRRHPERDSRR